MTGNLRTVLFCSRNKDNSEIENFKERKMSFLTSKSDEELLDEFEDFTARGLRGEFCRFYRSVNRRDENKVRKGLLHKLIDVEDMSMAELPQKVASIASKSENRAESKWLFDFDSLDKDKLIEFVDDIAEIGKVETAIFRTPNRYAVITEHGFDTRELLSKWKDVELKRDGLLCSAWFTNDWEDE